MRVFSALLALALVASVGVLSHAMAQMPAAGGAAAAGEKSVIGEIQSIDAAAKELTLKDGTKLVVKDATKMQGLKEGTTVAAKYNVQKGQNVVTSIDVQAPAASPPTTPPPATPPAPEKEKKQ